MTHPYLRSNIASTKSNGDVLLQATVHIDDVSNTSTSPTHSIFLLFTYSCCSLYHVHMMDTILLLSS